MKKAYLKLAEILIVNGAIPFLLWQLTALLCQSVTHFPIWCLVTVSFIFIQLWITGRAYVASPGAIMWNVVWEEELDAPQPRSDQQNKHAHWSCPVLTSPCLWDEETRAQRGQTLFIVAQNGVRGEREGLNTFNFNFTEPWSVAHHLGVTNNLLLVFKKSWWLRKDAAVLKTTLQNTKRELLFVHSNTAWQCRVPPLCSDWPPWYVNCENRNCLWWVGVLANRKAGVEGARQLLCAHTHAAVVKFWF